VPHVDIMSVALGAGLTGVLGWAAINDVRVRKIPNRAVLAVVVLYLIWTIVHRGHDLPPDAAAGAIALVVGYGLYAAGMVGAGDSKLFAATTLFAGVTLLPAFAVATALAGGVMAVGSIASRPRRALVMMTLKGEGDDGRGIPYGVAIAVGGISVVWLRICGIAHPFAELLP